jgi:hypothetical protein
LEKAWIPNHASDPGEASSLEGLRQKPAAATAVEVAAVVSDCVRKFPLVVNEIVCADVFAYCIAFCIKHRQHRMYGSPLISFR